jgi:CDP-glucose 4,6-dehydratase
VAIAPGTVEDLEVVSPDASPQFWRGKRVLLTGHTGFKGGWLAVWLRRLGAEVTGISLAPTTTPSLFALAGIDRLTDSYICDIRDASATAAVIRSSRAEIVFHLAAQPLVRASYREPVETFATNVQGTAHVMDALRGLDSIRVVVAITTDKVYQNTEHAGAYRETDPLGGCDPYSASKAAAEMVIESYRHAFLAPRGVAVASARAGNVIGGGDWSEDRLIPDAVRAWQSGQILEVRRPQAIRPWQHVLEALAAYLRLANRLWHEPSLAGPYNFGPESNEVASVRDVIELAREAYQGGGVAWGDGIGGPHEAGCLVLESVKARTTLGVQPRWDLGEALRRTMQWYRRQRDGASALSLCEADIADYEALLS